MQARPGAHTHTALQIMLPPSSLDHELPGVIAMTYSPISPFFLLKQLVKAVEHGTIVYPLGEGERESWRSMGIFRTKTIFIFLVDETDTETR